MKGISQRAYARHRDCALSTVQEAITSGRLKKSLVREGKTWRIRTPEAADAEWAANTKADRVPLTGPAASGGELTPAYADSRARREAAEAGLAELELAEAKGRVIPAENVEARLVDVFSGCKTKLLGVPSRVRQLDPTLTADQVALIERVIREQLEGLASGAAPAPKRARATG